MNKHIENRIKLLEETSYKLLEIVRQNREDLLATQKDMRKIAEAIAEIPKPKRECDCNEEGCAYCTIYEEELDEEKE